MKIGKRKIFLIIGLIVLVLAACSNVDGDLDDKWQLRQYQYADGSIERQDSIFYNFQKGSFSAICLLKNGSYQTFFGNYSLKGDKISIICCLKVWKTKTIHSIWGGKMENGHLQWKN